MKNYKDINNTRYFINRIFSKEQTTAMLIEERVKNNIPLTSNNALQYNNSSGSIQSQEVL